MQIIAIQAQSLFDFEDKIAQTLMSQMRSAEGIDSVRSFDHFINHGYAEGRNLSNGISLAQLPAIAKRKLQSGAATTMI